MRRIAYVYFGLALVVALLMSNSGSQAAYAQTPEDLFNYVPGGATDLTPEQMAQLEIYRAEPTTAEISLVLMQPQQIAEADSINLNLDDTDTTLEVVDMDNLGNQDFSWLAEAVDSADQATLVVMGEDVVGTIHAGNDLYRVRPLGGGLQTLILVDQSAFPPDHPPGYEEMEAEAAAKASFSSFELDVQDEAQRDDGSAITLLVAYTPGARNQAGNINALIDLAIRETNDSYVNSQIDTRMQLVHSFEINYIESGNMELDRDRFRIAGDGFMDEVQGLRNTYTADIAILITASGNYCGIAADIMATEATGFAVVGQDCATGYYSFGHEIGHLQGARHNPEADPTNTPFAYGHGFRNDAAGWRTIMAYNCPTNCTRRQYWSNPGVQINNVATGSAATHNNARVLNETRAIVANFRATPTGGYHLWIGNYGYNVGGWRVDQHPRFLADVNGDDLNDIVGFGNAGAYVSLSDGSSFSAPSLWVANYGYDAGGWRVDQRPRFLADVNGDGMDDIVGFGNAGAYVSLSDGSSFSAPSLWVGTYGYDAGGWRVDQHPRFLADVNGDGLADVIGFGNAGAYVSLSDGSNFSAPSLWVATYGYDAGGWRVDQHPRFLADVNGDGMDDIVGFGNAGAYVSLSDGSSFSAPSLWVATYGYDAGSWRVDQHPRFLADVNGDGMDDIVGFGNAGAYVSLSNGSSFSASSLWVANYGYSNNAGGWRVPLHPRFLADVNGDGMDDIVGFGYAGGYVSLSDGSSFSAPSLWVSTYGEDNSAGGWRVVRHPRYLADVNGDGLADVIGFGNAGAYVSLSNGANAFE